MKQLISLITVFVAVLVGCVLIVAPVAATV